MSASVSGADRLETTTRAAGRELEDLTTAGQRAGDRLLDTVRIPVRTGRLAGTAEVTPGPAGVALTVGGPQAPYAPYVDTDPTAAEAVVVDEYAAQVGAVVDQIEGA